MHRAHRLQGGRMRRNRREVGDRRGNTKAIAARAAVGVVFVLATGCGPRASDSDGGVKHVLRGLPGVAVAEDRAAKRVSLTYFGHLSDLHIVDEASPVRIEFVDPSPAGDYATVAAWRPQETLSAHAADDSIRALNERAISSMAQEDGTHASMSFALVTGDLVDNMQRNELGWAAAVLAGSWVEPHSGQPLSATNPCPGANVARRDALDAWAESRAYVGVQRYAQYPPGVPADRLVAFYDPDQAPPASVKPRFPRYDLPRYPGLLERSQERFRAEGLAVPYFVARGNHDTLLQGNYTPKQLETWFHFAERNLTLQGCRKVYPNETFDPFAPPYAAGAIDLPAQLKVLDALYGRAQSDTVGRWVPPDPRRVPIDATEFPAAFSDAPGGAGFNFEGAGVREAAADQGHYYAWSPTPGLRFISLDTNAEGGGRNGNLDDVQARWFRAELSALAGKGLAVVFGHHALETMDNNSGGDSKLLLGCPLRDKVIDCEAPYVVGAAPNLRDLLLEHPNVILYVTGHTHTHRITPFARGEEDGSGFWQITTASVVEWPQETRTIELLDNRDGSLSIFATVVSGTSSLPAPPLSGTPAGTLDHAELVSIARDLARGDVAWTDGPGKSARGRSIDRDVELVLRDPRERASAN